MFAFLQNVIFRVLNPLVRLRHSWKPGVRLDQSIRFPLDLEMNLARSASVTMGKVVFNRRTTVRVRENARLELGDGVNFNNGCLITCRHDIRVGKGVLFGPNVMVFDHDHDYQSEAPADRYRVGPILIEDNVWIGANAVILRGAHIKAGTVVGAGSVIKGTVGPGTVVYERRELVEKPILKN